MVVTPNLDHLRRCRKDVNFAALVAEADLVVADGMPLVWASRLQRTPLPERVAGSNLISTLSEAAAVRGPVGLPARRRARHRRRGRRGARASASPACKVAGTYCPPVGFESNTRVMGELHNLLTASKADIVYVALGSPKQERLIARLRPLLPGAWWLGRGQQLQLPLRPRPPGPDVDAELRAGVGPPPVPGAAPPVQALPVVGVPFGVSLLGRATLRRRVQPVRRAGGKAVAAATTDGSAAGRRSVELPADAASPATAPRVRCGA